MRLIDADALIEIAKENAPVYNFGSLTMKGWFIAALQSENITPTVESKRGRWEFVQYDANPKIGNYHCSECNWIAEPLNYCPHCGAKMEGETDEY